MAVDPKRTITDYATNQEQGRLNTQTRLAQARAAAGRNERVLGPVAPRDLIPGDPASASGIQITFSELDQDLQDRIDAGIGDMATPVQDVAELRDVGPAERIDKQTRLVEDKGALYRFDTADTTTPDDGDLVIAPNDSSFPDGRWFKMPSPTVPTPATSVVSETSFGQASAVGTGVEFARNDHTHGTPTNPVPAHEAAGDPHPGYQLESEKGAANGYAPLDGSADVPSGNLPAATESAQGALEIATQAETDAGTDDVRAITPLKLANSPKVTGPASATDRAIAIYSGTGGKLIQNSALRVSAAAALEKTANDGSGLIVGQVPSGPSTGSTARLLNVTTAQRDQLVPTDGMLVFNTTLGVIQQYRVGAWRHITGDRIVSFGSMNGVGLQSDNATFTVKARIPWRGSNLWGTLIDIRVIRSTDTATGRIRIQDVTNALTIATSVVIASGTPPGIISLGALSNVSVGEAVWEIQMIRDTGTGSNFVRCSALVLVFT